MTADSYSPTKEQFKDTKMVNPQNNKDVVLEVEDRHFLFKCIHRFHWEKATHCLAEIFGTAALVFIGCLGCVTGLGMPNPNLQSGLNFGLAILATVTIFGCISGCHINPAVTLAACIFRIVSLPMAFIYVICQLIGGLIGFGLIKAVVPLDIVFPNNSTIGLCTTMPDKVITPPQAMFIEIIITAILVWVVCSSWDPRNSSWLGTLPLKIGFTVSSMVIIAGPFTGASMNPARSFAPAAYNGNWEHHWVYWVGPLIGSLFSTLTYRYIFLRQYSK